ncbi:MAG: hypothetical protein OEX12_09280 [Gammaproteobacteria bacterium]|nr:hypothetical protein [Gammaproteobacteria bacterium]
MKNIAHTVLFMIIALTLSACTAAPGSGSAGNQGSIASPVSIGSYPVTSHAGTVDVFGINSGSSYYRVDGISPGGTYTVSLTSTTGNVSLDVYDSSDFFTDTLCFDFAFDIVGDRTCTTSTFGPVTGTSLYIEVSSDFNNTATSNFNISVQ